MRDPDFYVAQGGTRSEQYPGGMRKVRAPGYSGGEDESVDGKYHEGADGGTKVVREALHGQDVEDDDFGVEEEEWCAF
ncbi:hypothetical protein PSPO01_03352 [Paraphaeosphaeria sporulosa]